MSTVLTGHTSPDTAYVVDDYPYGFRLRCKIRYWLEYNPRRGFRFVSQTTNPKRPGLVWNKPKASTFCRWGGAMLLADNGHVSWTGIHKYSNLPALVAFRDKYGSSLPLQAQEALAQVIKANLAYEQAKAEGLVKSTLTTTRYGSITSPDFGKPIAPPVVETTILKSDYTPAQLAAMGRSLRSPIASEFPKLTGDDRGDSAPPEGGPS